ncbi:MAG: radical SAM protein [Thermodesulfobacteriota bacterium]|nr:radical SAM protein [Thermodesulfobacteriota bacterium]
MTKMTDGFAKRGAPSVLCVNPWIHDFAAYDFWAKPLGLLSLAAVLRQHEFHVSYIDCTDRFHQKALKTDPAARCGRGPYLKTPIDKPAGLEHIPRTYSRYGIKKKWFAESLRDVPVPDLVLVTSIMTYWYPGVRETIAMIREMFPETPVVLGGTYAALCEPHARRHSGADTVAAGTSENNILELVGRYTGWRPDLRFDPGDMDTWPYPALDLENRQTCVPLATSRGCPFSCPYCAASFLHPGPMQRRSPDSVVAEIEFWHQQHGICDFVFYDDALLVKGETYFIPMAEALIKKGWSLRFHTPNALHIQEITERTATLMKQIGMHTVRLGLETAAFEDRDAFDAKVTAEAFARAVACLKQAGFRQDQVGAYLLVGLPGQALAEIDAAIRIVAESGITPIPAYYTPIPHTQLWPAAVAASPYDLAADPVFANNALLPCVPEGFSWELLSHIKKQVAAVGV